MPRGIFNKKDSNEVEIGEGLKLDNSGKIVIDHNIVATDLELANLGSISLSEDNTFTGVNKFTNTNFEVGNDFQIKDGIMTCNKKSVFSEALIINGSGSSSVTNLNTHLIQNDQKTMVISGKLQITGKMNSNIEFENNNQDIIRGGTSYLDEIDLLRNSIWDIQTTYQKTIDFAVGPDDLEILLFQQGDLWKKIQNGVYLGHDTELKDGTYVLQIQALGDIGHRGLGNYYNTLRGSTTINISFPYGTNDGGFAPQVTNWICHMRSIALPTIDFKSQTTAEGAKYQYVLQLPSSISPKPDNNILIFFMNYIGAFPV